MSAPQTSVIRLGKFLISFEYMVDFHNHKVSVFLNFKAINSVKTHKTCILYYDKALQVNPNQRFKSFNEAMDMVEMLENPQLRDWIVTQSIEQYIICIADPQEAVLLRLSLSTKT